ncbi:effector binding domain-containing protein (plasmid) [Serratia ureilytica]|uniref:GyrI-like domain-containing protein n=1 Tax=Serratia ureilytica TaxID=300181 RepID=UPI001CC0679B|nr:effector binding domain-containing protein [Serratia ureilytica]UAN29800.1 effector binding domain-containing protein [Serratia ureilytica]
MKPTPIQLAGFCVAGSTIRTTNEDESQPETAKIPALWSNFFATSSMLPVYGVYSNYVSGVSGVFDVTVGNEGKSGLYIQPGRYLVFQIRGIMPAAVIEGWQAIWAYFAQHPEIERRFLTDFEAYIAPNIVDIHISIA